MIDSVVACLQLSRPVPLSLSSHFRSPASEIVSLDELRSRMCSVVNNLEISGSCEEAISSISDYKKAISHFASSPVSRRIRAASHPVFQWGALFVENEKAAQTESSTCIWFEVIMCNVLQGQLYYSMGVESLIEYEEGRQDEHLKNAAARFRYAAYMFMSARLCKQSNWITKIRDFDPTVRHDVFLQLWEKLCLAPAQHCFILRYYAIKKDQGGEASTTLAMLLMGEASFYDSLLHIMQDYEMAAQMRQLYTQVAQLYIENCSAAYAEQLASIETEENNVWLKITAWENLKSSFENRLPKMPHERLDEELKKLNRLIGSVYFVKRKEQQSVPRSMMPKASVKVKAEPPPQF